MSKEVFITIDSKTKLRLGIDSNSDFRSDYCLRISKAKEGIRGRWNASGPELKLDPAILPELGKAISKLGGK